MRDRRSCVRVSTRSTSPLDLGGRGLVTGDRERPAVGRELEILNVAVTQPIRLAHRPASGRVDEGHDAGGTGERQ